MSAGLAADGDFDLGGLGVGQCLLGGARRDQRDLDVGGLERAFVDAALGHNMRDDRMVEIVAAQHRIAAGGEHLEHPFFKPEDGNIESSAAEIVDRVKPLGALVETIGERGGGGLVNQPENLETGDPRRVLGRGPRRVVEIRRHGDHRLGYRAAERVLGALARGLENIRRNLDRTDRATGDQEPNHASAIVAGGRELERRATCDRLEIGGAAPHQSLDRGDHAIGIVGEAGHRTVADRDHLAVVAIGDHGGQQFVPVGVANNLGTAVAGDRDDGIGGAEIDADRRSVLVRQRRLSGLVDIEQHHDATLKFANRARTSPAKRSRYLSRVVKLAARAVSAAENASPRFRRQASARSLTSFARSSTAATVSASASASRTSMASPSTSASVGRLPVSAFTVTPAKESKYSARLSGDLRVSKASLILVDCCIEIARSRSERPAKRSG